MSFQELVGGSQQSSKGPAEAPDPRRPLKDAIFQINTSVARFRDLVKALGSAKDTPELRLRLQKLREDIRNLTEETSAKLKAISEADHGAEVSRGRKIADAKLAKDFQAVLKEFQAAQRTAATCELSYAPVSQSAALPSSHLGGDEFETNQEEQALLAEQRRQEVLVVENQRVFNEALIEEREQGIQDIQQQIGEVHEIFKDLAVLVREQGVMIDDIEMNIESSHASTIQGNRQLAKAAKSQKSNSSLACLLLAVFGVALLITIIVLAV